jgi:uncharacterized lipoprotein YajG
VRLRECKHFALFSEKRKMMMKKLSYLSTSLLLAGFLAFAPLVSGCTESPTAPELQEKPPNQQAETHQIDACHNLPDEECNDESGGHNTSDED